MRDFVQATSRSRCACESERANGKLRSESFDPLRDSRDERDSRRKSESRIRANPNRRACANRIPSLPLGVGKPRLISPSTLTPTNRRPSASPSGRGNRHDVWRSGFRRAREDAAEFDPRAHLRALPAGTVCFVNRADFLRDFKRAVATHEFERSQTSRPRLSLASRERSFQRSIRSIHRPRDACPASFSTRRYWRMPRLPSRIDAPGQLHPKFVFFPNLAGIYFARVVDLFAVALARSFHHRLPKAKPLRIVRFVGMNVVTLGAEAHRQNVVGEVSGFVPRRA